MKTSRSLLFAVSASFAGVLWLAASPALADGPLSKDKARTAQPSMMTSGKPQTYKVPVSDQTKIGLLVHRTARANARKNKWSVPMTGNETSVIGTANSNTGLRVDRLHLIRRGLLSTPVQCKNLHTHARAVCQRDAQLLKTNRIQLAAR